MAAHEAPLGPDKPAWLKPGMTPDEILVWAAAQRSADTAPEILPGTLLYMRLRPLLAGWLTPP